MQEILDEGDIKLMMINTKDNLANMLTKMVSRVKIQTLYELNSYPSRVLRLLYVLLMNYVWLDSLD